MKNILTRLTLHPLLAAIFIIAFIFYLLEISPLISDPDVPWHIVAGNQIRELGYVPYQDSFSYTSGDYRWLNISWLWDVFLSYYISVFGEESLVLITAMILAAIVVMNGQFLYARKSFSEDTLKISCFLIGMVLWHFLYPRPQIITYLMVGIFHFLMYRNRGNNLPISIYITVPLLMVLWVNCHGGYMTGHIIIGVYFIESLVLKQYNRSKQLFILGTLCGLAILINPVGWHIVESVLRSLNSSVTSYIQEWANFSFGKHLGLTIFVLAFIVLSNSRDKEIPLADKYLALFWFIASFYSIRNFPIAVILAAPYLAYNIEKSIVIQQHKNIDIPRIRYGLGAFMAILFIMAVMTPQIFIKALDKEVLINEQKVPVEAIEYIKANHNEKRMLNDYDLGGYLIYLNPENKVFIDGRAGTTYPEDILLEYIEFMTMNNPNQTNNSDSEEYSPVEFFKTFIKKHDIELIIVGKKKSFLKTIENSDLFTEVFVGKIAKVFIR